MDVGSGSALNLNASRTLTVALTIDNDGEIRTGGSSGRLFINGAVDQKVSVAGSGSVILSGVNDQITGAFDHTLENGADHTIEGFGQMGVNTINLLNRGSVIANINGQSLTIVPRTTFENVGGDVRAENGGIVTLNDGNFSSTGGGTYTIADGGAFSIQSSNFIDAVFVADDQDADLSNNTATVTAGSPTFNGVTNGVRVVVGNGRTLGTGDLTNNAVIELDSEGGFTSLSVNEADTTIDIGGTGRILMDNAVERIFGSTDHTLINGANHTIEGGGLFGSNFIKVENFGTVLGNVPGIPLYIDPRPTLVNNGGLVRAEGGGEITLADGTFSSVNGGVYEAADDSLLSIRGSTLMDAILEADDQDADPTNNAASVVASSTFNGVVSNLDVSVVGGQLLTLTDVENNGVIHPETTAGFASLFVVGAVDDRSTLSGTGRIVLDSTLDRIYGATDHTLVQGADHTIEGGGSFGVNFISVENRGTILGNLPGTPLDIDARASFVNDGGVVRAEGGGSIIFRASTYSSANGGEYIPGDSSELIFSSSTMEDAIIAIDDGDADPSNNVGRVSATATFTRVVSDATILIDNGQTMNAFGSFENNGTVQPEAATGFTSLFVGDPDDGRFDLLGSGRVVLDNELERIFGTTDHFLVNGPEHTIEGGGSIGSNLIQVENRGAILGNLPGTPLDIDPRTMFINDGGIAKAEDGGSIIFRAATYTAPNGGSYAVGDGSMISFASGSLVQDAPIAADDGDSDILNNVVSIIGGTTFLRATNDALVSVGNGITLTGSVEVVNDGVIRLDSTGGFTFFSINDPDDGEFLLSGSGRLQFSSSLERIIGATEHVLINGPEHTIEGGGQLGSNFIDVRNLGTILANNPDAPIQVDTRTNPLANAGLIQIDTGCQLTSAEAVTQSAGECRVNGTFTGPALTLTGGLLSGTGTVDANTSATDATVAPGNSVGTLAVDGTFAFGAGSLYTAEVASGASADLLAITGALSGAGNAALELHRDGPSSGFSPADTITIVTFGSGAPFAFSNVADGGRLTTADGLANFQVNYLANSVTLTDPDLAPDFAGTPYQFSVQELVPPGTLVGTIAATDPEGADVTLSLAGGGPFDFDPETGEITTNAFIDFETQPTSYALTATASDGGLSRSVGVTITILDLQESNDDCVLELLAGPGGAFEGEYDRAITGAGADPDKDGLPNAFELWLGLDPATSDRPAPGMIVVKTVDDGGTEFGAAEVRVQSAIDDRLAIGCGVSFDLATFREATRAVLGDDGTVRTLEFRDPDALPGSGAEFFARFLADINAVK
ncbi:MAG: cadherin repeat domain-containing protein [Verrucomicrobiales bacterium]